MLKNFRVELPLHLMLLPGLVIIIVYSYGPMFGIIMAFQNYFPTLGFTKSPWVGLDNFTYILSVPDTMKVFWNTLTIALLKIVAGLIVPLAASLLLNEVGRKMFKKSVQSLIYLPHFLSWVIVGGIMIDILSPSQGIVNQFLGFFGIQPIYFLGDSRWFRFILVISNEWKEFGFSTIIYLAALSGINPSLYEAAVLDGAGRWRQTWHITFPGMRPIIILMMTLSLGNVLNAGFEQVFVLYSPQVYDTGDILDTMVYRIGLVDAQYSLASAVGLMKSAISLVLITTSYWLAYRLANYRIF
ncbi:ABC transporter permease [Paenibacillus eucommiae]|uniref:Aldouronate transport system permease protein n=1 Tax=Paenibacillus eucommiae TaxID=1355755 RepID=A0ABS4J354_9BACL|nr:ABC transporter permease subunit [Paenibacillus eucommiae]MBP1994281.1 putative aldouronate transport system permease protein [Paenibacillus eucommiae]